MWYKVYSCNLLLPSLRNLENRLEIKLIVFVLLANSDTYIKEKKLVQLQTIIYNNLILSYAYYMYPLDYYYMCVYM